MPDAFPSALELVARAFERVLVPPPMLSVPDWAVAHRVIPASGGHAAGPWRHRLTPYLVQPMRLAGGAAMGGDPRVHEVVLVAGGQSGKTEFIVNVVMAWMHQKATAVQWTIPDEGYVNTFIRPRFYHAWREVRALMDLTPAPLSRSMTNEVLQLSTGAYCKYASSNVDAQNVSTPAALAVLDETDTNGFNADVIEDCRTRGVTFPDRMLIQTGVPSDEGAGIDAECASAQQRFLQCPCPLCGGYQELDFYGLKWEGGPTASLERVEETLVYECEHCREGIPVAWQAWMVARCWWVVEGTRLEGDGRLFTDDMLDAWGGYVDDTDPAAREVVKEAGTPRVADPVKVGYRIPGMASLLRVGGWLQLAKEFVIAKGRPGKKWFNSKLGKPYAEHGDRAEPHAYRSLCSPPRVHGGYSLGELPGGPGVTTGWGYGPPFGAPAGPFASWGGPRALVAAVDVQKSCLYLEVAAYGIGGEREWLVWIDRIPRLEGNKLRELDGLIDDCCFPWQTPPSPEAVARGGFFGSLGLKVGAWVIDSGKYHDEVYQCVLRARARGRTEVFACKGQGDGQAVYGSGFELTAMTIDAAGHAVPAKHGGLQLLKLRVGHYKDKVHAQTAAALELVKLSGGDLSASPLAYPDVSEDWAAGKMDEYFRHQCAEHRVPVKAPRDGSWRAREMMWVKRPGLAGKDNHYLDTRVYRAALADARGVLGLGGDPQAPPAGGAGEGIKASRHPPRGIEGDHDEPDRSVAPGRRSLAPSSVGGYLAEARERLGGLGGGGGLGRRS